MLLALPASYTALASPRYLGPGSCSSSNCHGNVKSLNSSDVLQNEYVTWSKHDRHSRAYLSLLNEDSKKIAANLNIGAPSKEPLCLKCHSTYVPEADRRGPKFQHEDGVSCESCHGAAEGWLQSHAVDGTTHADNVKNGLTDLGPLNTRAQLCLSCHYGTEDKTVNHNLYGAGHPRLSFELDTFGVLQPKHWVVDADYEKRKGPYHSLAAWMTGQLHHAESTIEALKSPSRSKNGMFPELSLFDCFSCHHSLTEDQWKKRSYNGAPGQLKLNLPSLIILREATSALNKNVSDELGAQITVLHTTYKNDGAPEAIEAIDSILTTKVQPLVEKLPTDPVTATHVLKALAQFAANQPWPTYELAEQLGMGMQAAVASSPELAKIYGIEIKELFGTLKSSKAFAAEKFTAAAKKLNRSTSHTR